MPTQNNTMIASDFNMEKLTTKDLSLHIAATIKMGGNIAIFGRRGTGKTEIAREEIKKADCLEVYINLSVLERVDMGGYPDIMSVARQKRFVEFLLPKFYEAMIEGNRPVVALLDEVDKADPSLWAPLLEFTQFHTINGCKLPNLQAVIMTGNLISEGGARPSPPLLDRSEKFLVEADVASWLNWAGRTRRIHPSITAYIHDNPKDLFGAIDPEERYADPSPRGWDRASQIIFKGEGFGWGPIMLNKKVSGCVGKDAGQKYSSYYEHYMELLPMIEAIYQGKNIFNEYKDLEPTKQIIICMITCSRLSNILDQFPEPTEENPIKIEDLPKSIPYIGNFLNKVSYENILVSVRSQIQVDRIIKYSLDDHPDWSAVLGRVSKEIDQ